MYKIKYKVNMNINKEAEIIFFFHLKPENDTQKPVFYFASKIGFNIQLKALISYFMYTNNI